jgi:RimJ/RimL family protein N-acetyltransferase
MQPGRIDPPDPPLVRGPVSLRRFRLDDADAVAAACSDPSIPRYTMMPEGLTPDSAATWIARSLAHWHQGDTRFAVVDTDSGVPLGQVGMFVLWHYVSAEAYYWVTKQARGRGVASTALAMISDWAFDVVGIERLWLLTHLDNATSQRVATRCGYVREGVLREYMPFKGTRPDLVSWSLLPGDVRPWRPQTR